MFKKVLSVFFLVAAFGLLPMSVAVAEVDVCDIEMNDGCTWHIVEDAGNPGYGWAGTDCYSPGEFYMSYGALGVSCPEGA